MEKPENTQALYSIEQGDDIRHYKAAEEYSINDILNAANNSSPFLKLMDMGEQISIVEYAEIQQSDRFSFSVEMNFDSLSGTIYEVNGGKGGIAEDDRTDDNIRFTSGKLSELREKEAKNVEQTAHEVKFSDFYSEPSFFDTVDNVDVTISSETVRCKITADFKEKPDMRGFGETFYNGGESRFSNKACDFAMVYVEIPNENGEPESVELYAECNPKDVPGEGHYEKGEDEDGEWEVWVPDDESASEKFLLVALEKAAEAVANEYGIETPFHAPQISEKEESNPLSDSLYEKVNGEYKAFITDMQKQDTATAIESAYEIVWKDNITQFLENENPDLTEAQCNALLSSKNTLDEIYERFLKMDGMSSYEDIDFVLKDTADRIISAAEREREAHMTAPLILHDAQTARSLGENGLNDFRSSLRENRACAEAIIAAKKENTTYGEMAGVCFFDAAKTVDDVLAKGFPPERLGFVIASQVVRDQNSLNNPRIIDGRFTNQVKDWAIKLFSQQKNFPFRNFEDCDITSAMHHTLVNSLAEKFIGKQVELSKTAEMEKSAENVVIQLTDHAEADYILYSAGWDAHQAELTYYAAQAVDDSGNEYSVFWEITNEYKQLLNDDPEYAADNQDEACDWDDYKVYSDVSYVGVALDGSLEIHGEQIKNAVIADNEYFISDIKPVENENRVNSGTEKKPSVLGKIQKIKSEQKAREAAAPQKKEKSKSNNQEL